LESGSPDVVFIEKIEYSKIPYEQLPEKARENLGIHPNQKSVVATLTFRSLEGSMPKTIVNEWMQAPLPQIESGGTRATHNSR